MFEKVQSVVIKTQSNAMPSVWLLSKETPRLHTALIT